jgi:hypothetical protein
MVLQRLVGLHWVEVGRALHLFDPFSRPVVHPGGRIEGPIEYSFRLLCHGKLAQLRKECGEGRRGVCLLEPG